MTDRADVFFSLGSARVTRLKDGLRALRRRVVSDLHSAHESIVWTHAPGDSGPTVQLRATRRRRPTDEIVAEARRAYLSGVLLSTCDGDEWAEEPGGG